MNKFAMVSLMIISASHVTGCLLVIAGAAGEAGYIAGQDRSAGTTMSDQLITTKIKTKLIADEIVKARNVNVDTYDGVVTLRGIVFSSRQKARAQSLARETTGVKKVISHLKISP
jgi:osmotically-inducible protein OsmY